MKNEIYDSMLSRYELTTEQNKRNAIFEVNQQVILAGLYSGGFFESSAFYGGTCLRIFHGLQRFSEDMDFCRMSIRQELEFMENLRLEGNMAVIAEQIVREIKSRLRFLKDVENYLDHDIRMDMDEFYKFDATIFEEYIKVGKKADSIATVLKFLRR